MPIKKRLLRAGGRGPSTSKDGDGNSTSTVTVWKFLAFVLFGIVILMATDLLEIKLSVSNNGGGSNSGTKSSSDKQRSSEFGANVQQKEPQQHHHHHQQQQQNATDSVSDPIQSPSSSSSTTSSPQDGKQENVGGDDRASGAAATGAADAGSLEKSPPTGTTTSTTRVTYQRRGQPMNETDREAMIDRWGSWTLVDTKERPTHDYYLQYPNRDIPRTEFPANAWQIDKEYLAKFLPEGIALVQRAQDAILAEYGKTPTETDMFDIEHIPHDELLEANGLNPFGRRGRFQGRPSTIQGGWTTPNSWEGLKKRMLHAIMTEDNFIFAMAGHSAAAGHGNHFQQSYTLQVQWILEAVFARLGVRHQARNFGNGGLGTLQHGVASAGVFGPDVDVLMWDSGMTEGDNGSPEMMSRQQILGGAKVPAIWTLHAESAKTLYLDADADTGFVGSADSGIQMANSLEELESMPWAMRYMKCNQELSSVCSPNKFIGRCWIDRDDFAPPIKQNDAPGGRASWHPGNRSHQITGRVLAYTFLQAIKESLTEWNEADGYEIPDGAWHLTGRYESTRNKVKSPAADTGHCHEHFSQFNLESICNTPMKSRTEFTPRAYPTISNLRELMRPEMRAIVGEAKPSIYEPPDVFNPDLHPPHGEIDVLSVVEAGVDFRSVLSPDYTSWYKRPKFEGSSKVPIGKGPTLFTAVGDTRCDGSVDSWCKKGEEQSCLLYNHNDGRNGILFDEVSGWTVMNLPELKNGIIIVKLETWHFPDENTKTEGWTTVNNERRLGKRAQHEMCDNFKFEFAIDGVVTTWNRTELDANRKHVERVVEFFSLLNQSDYTGGVEKEVEVAIQIHGCPRDTGKAYKMSHIYWS